MLRYIFTVLSLSLIVTVKAQVFRYEASVKGNKGDSLYKIELLPEHTQFMSSDLHDVRLFDSKQTEVPYVILSEPVLKAETDFVPYEIVSQKHFKNYTEVIIHNPDKQKISNIAFNINNSDAFKYCSIEGSEDMKQWYSVSELQELSLAYNQNYTNQYKCIYFPLNNYRYFRLLVDDWYAQPLKINTAGYFKNSVIAGKLNPVKFTKIITQDKENKLSTIELKFANNQRTDRIDFHIKSPRLYRREATIYANRTYKRKGTDYTEREVLARITLASDAALMFDVPALSERELFIEIENKDNPPLEIDSISCTQLATYLIADLKSGEMYTVKSGNEHLKRPEYDLGNFVIQIPQLMPKASLEPFALIEQPQTKPIVKEIAFYETQSFLWICLGAGAVIIGFFSLSLLKSMKENKE